MGDDDDRMNGGASQQGDSSAQPLWTGPDIPPGTRPRDFDPASEPAPPETRHNPPEAESVVQLLRRAHALDDSATLVQDEDVEGSSPLDAISSALPSARYGEGREIARGGMGAILEIFDRDVRRPVAMKVILDDPDRGRMGRFIEEAQITGQLEHPNIVPVHEIGVDGDGKVYFTMKRVRGRSLEDIVTALDRPGETGAADVSSQPRPLPDLLRVFLKICDAVAFAHDRGVIHRDLKPDNVMVGRFGEVLVMDWGLAKLRASTTAPEDSPAGRPEPDAPPPDGHGLGDIPETAGEQPGGATPRDRVSTAGSADGSFRARTLDGTLVGTPSYMPPEQADGRIGQVGTAADVWALGGILYFLLCRAAPYSGESLANLLVHAVEARFDSPRSRRPDLAIPAELEAICLKAMARRPEDRYPDVLSLGDDVQAFLDRRLVSAYRYSAVQRLSRWVQRHPTTSVAAGVATVMLALGGLIASFLVQQARISELRAREAERLQTAAENRASQAEVEADAAKQALDKGRQVSKVLRMAHAELSAPLEDMLAAYHSPASLEQVQAVADLAWPRVESLESRIEGDRASQAAWQAVNGWLSILAGRRDRGMALLRESRRTDPDVALGALFEAMFWMLRYLENLQSPCFYYGVREMRFKGFGPESDVLVTLRKKLIALLDQAREAPVWGESSAEEFGAVLAGLRGLQTGDAAMAVDGLSRALGCPEMAWFRVVLLYGRGLARFYRGDMAKALRDMEAVRKITPDHVGALYLSGNIRIGLGSAAAYDGTGGKAHFEAALDLFDRAQSLVPDSLNVSAARSNARLYLARLAVLEGGDPRELLTRARADLNAVLAADPASHTALISLASVLTSLAQAEGDRGGDPAALLKKAEAACAAVLETVPDHPVALNNRGTARLGLASADEFPDAHTLALFQAAIGDFQAALPLTLDRASIESNLGAAFSELGELQFELGADGMDSLKRSVRHFDAALALRPRLALALLGRSAARGRIAWQRLESGDHAGSLALYEASLEDAKTAGDLVPGVRAMRRIGLAWQHLAHATYRAGQDPGPLYRNALATYGAILADHPDFGPVLFNRAQALREIGDIQAEQGGDPRPAFERAAADYQICLDQGVRVATVLDRFGNVAVRMADALSARQGDPTPWLEKAVALFTRRLESNPGEAHTLSNRCHALRAIGDRRFETGSDPSPWYARALEDGNRAIAADPENVSALRNRGAVLGKKGDWVQFGGGDPRALYSEAAGDLERALALSGGHVDDLWRLGTVRLRRLQAERGAGDPAWKASAEQAIQTLKAHAEKKPGDARAFSHLGMAQEAAGLHADAVKSYEKTVAILGRAGPALALNLARARLSAAGHGWTRKLELAECHVRCGNYAAAAPLLEAALGEAAALDLRDDPEVGVIRRMASYNLACARAVISEGKSGPGKPAKAVAPQVRAAHRAAAIAALEKFKSLGGDMRQALADGDLASLREDPAFQALTRD